MLASKLFALFTGHSGDIGEASNTKIFFAMDKTSRRTFIQFHVCEGLPFVHGYEPGIAFSSTAEIDDEFALVVL